MRAFVAVEIDSALRRAIARIIDELRRLDTDVKWVAVQNLHVTLKFLGDNVPDQQAAEICGAVTEAVADLSAFDLEVRGTGAFPRASHPRTVWLGLADGCEPLATLQKKVDRALRGLGFPREGRPFSPHLTIGRARSAGRDLPELGRQLVARAAESIGRCRVDHVAVFSSILGRGEPIHEALARAVLRQTEP